MYLPLEKKTYSECVCVCVSIAIQLAMSCVVYIVICGLTGCTIFFHIS